MAYEFTKLSEITEISSASNPKLIVENEGEIVRIAASEVITGGGGGGNSGDNSSSPVRVIYAHHSQGTLMDKDYNSYDGAEIYRDFASGTRIIVKDFDETASSEVLSVYYTSSTNSFYVNVLFIDNISDVHRGEIVIQQLYTSNLSTAVATDLPDDVVVYECNSGASTSMNGHNMDHSSIASAIANNKRIIVHYTLGSSDTAGTTYDEAYCPVISSYTIDGTIYLVIMYPGSTDFRTITVWQ